MGNKSKSFGGLAIITAIAASLCCITPVFAFMAGIGGMATRFSWIEPYRPYLIGLSILFLGIAWYQKLKPVKEIDCECESEKLPFFHSKMFLGIMTVFAGLMFAFPYFSHNFYADAKADVIEVSQKNLEIIEFSIKGMTCAGCEEHIIHAVNALEGIQSVEASYTLGSATVYFDKTKTNKQQVGEAINATGYKVIQ